MVVHSTDFKTNLGKYLDLSMDEDIYILRNGKLSAKLVRCSPSDDMALLQESNAAYAYKAEELTYDAFLKMYEKKEDRMEYIDGHTYSLASPGHLHQVIVRNMFAKLYAFFQGKTCQPFFAPYDIHFESSDNKACVQPDIFVMCDPEKVVNDKYYGVPALVIEVLSPATQTKDTLTKLNLYWREGVSEYMLVDPAQKVVHYWFFEKKELVVQKDIHADQVFQSNVFQGLEIRMNEVF
jgi:Uma2 family endonuclease